MSNNYIDLIDQKTEIGPHTMVILGVEIYLQLIFIENYDLNDEKNNNIENMVHRLLLHFSIFQ